MFNIIPYILHYCSSIWNMESICTYIHLFRYRQNDQRPLRIWIFLMSPRPLIEYIHTYMCTFWVFLHFQEISNSQKTYVEEIYVFHTINRVLCIPELLSSLNIFGHCSDIVVVLIWLSLSYIITYETFHRASQGHIINIQRRRERWLSLSLLFITLNHGSSSILVCSIHELEKCVYIVYSSRIQNGLWFAEVELCYIYSLYQLRVLWAKSKGKSNNL